MSVTEAMKEFHWLPIHQRIKYKLLSLVFKSLNDAALNYLQNLLCKLKHPVTSLRSTSDDAKLIVPFARRATFAERSFSVAGPKLWNDLQKELREIKSLESFKKLLQTHLFTKHYSQ